MARAAMLLKSIPGSEMQHTIKKYSLLNLGWCFCDILGFLQIAIHPIQMWCTTIWWKVAKSFVFVSFLGCVLGSVPPRPSNIQFVGSGTAWRSTHRDQRKASAPQFYSCQIFPGFVACSCIATLPYWHYHVVLRWYLRQPEQHQSSLNTQWVRDIRTPGKPGSDKNFH